MADQTTKTDFSSEAAASGDYTPSPTDSPDKPDFFQKVVKILERPKKSGAQCEYCGWSGPSGDVLKSPRLNEDGTTYQINTCPSCMRNGGLLFFD